MSPVDLSPSSCELHQLLGLMEEEGEREDRERGEGGKEGERFEEVHDIIWLLGMSILGEYIYTQEVDSQSVEMLWSLCSNSELQRTTFYCPTE